MANDDENVTPIRPIVKYEIDLQAGVYLDGEELPLYLTREDVRQLAVELGIVPA